MGSTQVAHALNSSALSEAQSAALARIYTRALERYYERKKAAEPHGLDGTKLQGDSADAQVISR